MVKVLMVKFYGCVDFVSYFFLSLYWTEKRNIKNFGMNLIWTRSFCFWWIVYWIERWASFDLCTSHTQTHSHSVFWNVTQFHKYIEPRKKTKQSKRICQREGIYLNMLYDVVVGHGSSNTNFTAKNVSWVALWKIASSIKSHAWKTSANVSFFLAPDSKECQSTRINWFQMKCMHNHTICFFWNRVCFFISSWTSSSCVVKC